MKQPNCAAQSGFSLLEFCIAMAVYSVGLAGFSLLLMLAMQSTVNAENRSWAAMYTASIADLMVMNSDASDHRIFPDQGAADNWHDAIGKRLPGGNSTVCADSSPNDGDALDAACDGSGRQVMKIFWTTPGGPDEARTPARMASHLPQ